MMKRLLEKQEKLDDCIVKKLCERIGKDITHQQLAKDRMLALVAEFGEFIEERHEIKKRLEYADIIHFLLSLGLTYDLLGGYENYTFARVYQEAEAGNYYEDIANVNIQISKFLNSHQGFKYWKVDHEPKPGMLNHYKCLLMTFLNLGKTMGYSAAEIIECYIEKNRINYERQASNY